MNNFLSSRDIDVLVLTASYRYLSRHQFERFLFVGSSLRPTSLNTSGWRILQRLIARGLLAHTPRLVGGPAGGSNAVAYFLTRAGYRVALSLNPSLPAKRLPSRGTFLMRHALMTAEIALAFREAARERPGHEVMSFENDWAVALKLDSSFVVPDAYLVYSTGVAILHAFIEVDLGTEGTRFFRRKVERYIRLYQSARWSKELTIWPTILVVTETSARATMLQEATEAALSAPFLERVARAMSFRFATLADLVRPNGLFAAIWRVAGRDGLHELVPPKYMNPDQRDGDAPTSADTLPPDRAPGSEQGGSHGEHLTNGPPHDEARDAT